MCIRDSHYTIEDIRVEGHVWRLIYLQMRKTVWSPQPDYGEIDHIFFNNIQIEGPVLFKSLIRGATDDYGSQNVHYYHDIYMDSLMVNGECMTRDDFIIDENTTYNIQVGCGYFEPTINIHRPKNHSAYDYGSDIEVAVSASAYKGKIDNVELYIDDTLVRKSYSAPHLWGTNYGDSLLSRLRPGFYDFKVIAEDTAGTFVEKIVNVTVKNELPENWNITDIGELPYKGISILSDSGFIMSSPGKSLGALRDEFHYLFQRKNGDSEIIAFINNFTCDYEWAKLGLMIREELDPGSRHATIGITPQNGSFFTSRAFPNSFSNQYVPNDEEEVPVWLKMTRMGNNFSGYTSFDGLNWIKISEAEIEMSDNVYIGIALAGKDENDPALAYIDSVFVEGGPVSVEYWQEDMIPNEIKLYQNYPNPFNPSTKIKYSLPAGSVISKYETVGNLNNNEMRVSLVVYDLLGRKLATLVDKIQSPGNHEVTFKPSSGVTSGIYYYRLIIGDYSETRKMIMLR
jgi:regulation of enolase protein 1 (concanavalin A-like superfamily)